MAVRKQLTPTTISRPCWLLETSIEYIAEGFPVACCSFPAKAPHETIKEPPNPRVPAQITVVVFSQTANLFRGIRRSARGDHMLCQCYNSKSRTRTFSCYIGCRHDSELLDELEGDD